ncbi:MAG: peptidylprolyl isomerase [Enterobacterales bacterium]|nr:peptidylprolyl isomerase [Enterobacterales bacterium]
MPQNADQKNCNLGQRGADIQPNNLFPVVEMQTTAGKIVIELNRLKAPITVNNFLYYVVSGTYDGTIFHRVVKDFVVQGGGYNEKLEERAKQSPIYNESGNGLKNELYSIAMARDDDPHSAVRQFYFNMGDNEGLDPGKTWGYTVFGMVMEGDEVLDLIANAQTHVENKYQWENVPIKPIFLNKALLKDPE